MPDAHPRLRLGISACLLGEPVRYDGGHKRDEPLLRSAGPDVEWVAVCPEVEIGMGTPREPVRLVRTSNGVRMLGVASGRDWTDAMCAFASERVDALGAMGLDGFVLKARSPSCGLRGVDVRGHAGQRPGLFAAALLARFPGLPVEDETVLADPAGMGAFLQHAAAHRARSP